MNTQPQQQPTISNTSGIPSSTSPTQQQQEQYYALVADLLIPEKRENALLELSKKRENFANLALTLWHSVGVIAVLLQVSLLTMISNS